MKLATVFALPVLIALPAAAPAPSKFYKAHGTEPFWSLTVARHTIIYTPATGRKLTVTKPRPIVGINGELYRARGMTVDITHVRCSDGMSDQVYADTVKLTIGRRTLSGCGGEIVPSGSKLADNRYTISAVDMKPVTIPADANDVSFTADRIEGRAGCNRFGGSYTLKGNTLTPGPLMATRMACPGEAMQVETRVLGILRSPAKVTWGKDGIMLTNATGSVTLKVAH